MERIELTPDQQRVLELDSHGKTPQRAVDPRTQISHGLVPEAEYEALQELLEDDRREQAIHAMALRYAASRLDEIP